MVFALCDISLLQLGVAIVGSWTGNRLRSHDTEPSAEHTQGAGGVAGEGALQPWSSQKHVQTARRRHQHQRRIPLAHLCERVDIRCIHIGCAPPLQSSEAHTHMRVVLSGDRDCASAAIGFEPSIASDASTPRRYAGR